MAAGQRYLRADDVSPMFLERGNPATDPGMPATFYQTNFVTGCARGKLFRVTLTGSLNLLPPVGDKAVPENKQNIVMQGRVASANLATVMDAMATYVSDLNACGYQEGGSDPTQESDLTPPPADGSQSQPILMAEWTDFLYAAAMIVAAYEGGQNEVLNHVRP